MWRFAAACAVGASHERQGLPRQDRVLSVLVEDGTLISAVADGAGSASKAEIGAQIVVDVVCAYASEAIADGRSDYDAILREAASAARDANVNEARRTGSQLKDYASTLLATIVRADGSGGALQIGDGVIAVSDDGEGWSWVFWPQRGDYANTTFFLTDANAFDQIVVDVFSVKIADLSMMTDGLESLALHYATRTVFDPFFKGMIGPLIRVGGIGEQKPISEALEKFLMSERVRGRSDDDVSLVIATRRLGL